MVDGWSQLGVVSGLDDVTSGGCLVLDVGVLGDSLRLPTEGFEDRDGLPALTRQQVWGVGTIDHVVAWVVDAGAEVVVVEVLCVVGRRADCSRVATVGSLAWAARRTAWASWICFCVGGSATGGIVVGWAGGLEDVAVAVPSGVSRRFSLHV